MESDGENKGCTTTLKFLITYNAPELKFQNIKYNVIDYKRIIFIVDDCSIIQRCIKETLRCLFDTRFEIFCLSNGEQLLNYDFLNKNITRYIHIIDENMELSGGILKGSGVASKLKQREFKYNESHNIISMSGSPLNKIQSSYFDFLWEKPPPPNDIIKKHIELCSKNSIDLVNSLEFIDV